MSDRLLRINERMRRVLGEAVADLSDPRIGFVTITGVSIARDFRNAKVFVSVLGNDSSKDDTLRALRSAHGLLQRAVARDSKLHHTPQLEFVYDDTTDSAMRLEEILKHGEENTPGEHLS
jgi:ribosome-binding factor A